MALLFAESWDVYDTAHMSNIWTGADGTIVAGEGRCATAALLNNTSSGPYIGLNQSGNGGYAGMAYKMTSYNALANFAVSPSDGGIDVSFFVRVLSDGSIDLWIGPNTTLGTQVCVTDPGLHTVGTYFHLGIEWLLSATGYFKIFVNGVQRTEADFSGNTISPYNMNPVWNIVSFRPLGYCDDIYVGDLSGPTTGTNDDAFMGDVHVEGQVVDAEGFYQDWALSTGTDAVALLDAIPPNDGATYVSSATPGDIISMGFPPIVPASGAVLGIQLMPNMLKTAFATRTVRNIWRYASTDANGATQALAATSYKYYFEVSGGNPVAGAAWTVASANSVEGGVEVVA